MEEDQIQRSYAGAKKVDNIIATIDVNNQQIDGSIDPGPPYGPLRPSSRRFGWGSASK